MLEILILWSASGALGKVAERKGRSKGLGWLFAVGWVLGEVFGFIVGIVVTGGETLTTYVIALICALLGGGAAWLIVASIPAPDGFVPADGLAEAVFASAVPDGNLAYATANPIPPAPQPATVQRRAGYCLDCEENVWLTGSGGCPNGHGPQSLTNCYTADG